MPEALLPLFPLPLVLFPRTPLPLHIFEERYRTMINDCLQNNAEFGVVQATEKGIANSGCTAAIDRVLKRYPDGQLDILTTGRRRFEIVRLNDEADYLRGTVEYYDDDRNEEADSGLRQRAVDQYRTLSRLEDDQELPPADESDPQLSFQLAQPVQDLQFRQLLLSLKSETARLRHVVEFLPGYVSRLQKITHVKDVAPRNGHSTWPANL